MVCDIRFFSFRLCLFLLLMISKTNGKVHNLQTRSHLPPTRCSQNEKIRQSQWCTQSFTLVERRNVLRSKIVKKRKKFFVCSTTGLCLVEKVTLKQISLTLCKVQSYFLYRHILYDSLSYNTVELQENSLRVSIRIDKCQRWIVQVKSTIE